MTVLHASAQPGRRVIVLGASNVTRGLRTFCQTAARVWGQPLDIMAAIGLGRSYGQTSRVFGRTLPGIRQCEMWEEWHARDPLPTAALITDIGNDILYGASPRQIADWVRECCERLLGHCQCVAVTALPMESVNSLGKYRFNIMRSLLFPSSRMTFQSAVESARELDARVMELAKAFNIGRTQPELSWFGMDPIHIRRRYWRSAWEQFLDPWNEMGQQAERTERVPVADFGWRLTRLRPKHQWFLGVEQRHEQPAWTGADGSRLSLY